MFVGHIEGHRIHWVPFSRPLRPFDIIANILLYVPLGYFDVRRRATSAIGVATMWGLALSIVTEATQLFSHGRFPSATDVVCNTVGAALGAVLAIGRIRR